MATTIPVPTSMHAETHGDMQQILASERSKSLLLRAWIFSGLCFMALPGTLLGFSNLMVISSTHGLHPLPAVWMQGHGHAQVYGWIGSFILGIGFYSQPMKNRAARTRALACFLLWTLGVALRWFTCIYGWQWRALLPLSAAMELVAWLLFYKSASGHKRAHPAQPGVAKAKMPVWMVSVLISTAGFFAVVAFNAIECVLLAVRGSEPAFPHALDQRYLLLMGWGLLVPVVWGFSARWLPAFLGIPNPDARLMRIALLLDLLGLGCGLAGLTRVATFVLASSTVVIAFALHLLRRPQHPAKTQGIHPSFPWFPRLSYLWLGIAGALSVWAAQADLHGGIWGASRHALTVGFAATMVFSIGPRILPHFGGVHGLFSRKLMFASLLLLQTGCTLRVTSEPLAYEGLLPFAWKMLPVSGVLELSAVLLFAANMALTFLAGASAFAAEPQQAPAVSRA